jgi:hypothetical protein
MRLGVALPLRRAMLATKLGWGLCLLKFPVLRRLQDCHPMRLVTVDQPGVVGLARSGSISSSQIPRRLRREADCKSAAVNLVLKPYTFVAGLLIFGKAWS